jgi:hypothetical protein
MKRPIKPLGVELKLKKKDLINLYQKPEKPVSLNTN